MTDPYTGTIGLQKADSAIGKVIVFFERLRDRPNGWNPFKLGEASKSHVFILTDGSNLIETHMFQGVRSKPYFLYDKKDIELYMPTFINDIIKKNMVSILRYVVGDSYGWGKLPLHALDGIFKTYWFTKKMGISNFKDCTNLAGWIYKVTPTEKTNPIVLYKIAKGKYDSPKALNYEFGCKWQSLQPDKQNDFIKNNPRNWEKVVVL